MRKAIQVEGEPTERIPGICPECGSGIDHIEERVIPGFEWAVIQTFYPCGHERVRRVHREIVDRLRFRNATANGHSGRNGKHGETATLTVKGSVEATPNKRNRESGHQINNLGNGSGREDGTNTDTNRTKGKREKGKAQKRESTQQAP